MKKKIFIVCIIFLLISVSIIPATSGLELKKIGIKKTDSKRSINEKIIGERPHLTAFLNRVEYNRFEIIEGKGYSIYEIDYAVKNTGTSFYLGKPLHEIIEPDSLWHVFSDWYNIFPLFLLKGREKSFSKEIKINSGVNIETGDERYFAGQIAQLSVGFRLDHPEDVESSYQYVKYWNDNINYEPTLAHLLVSTPWRYNTKTIEINGKEEHYFKSNNTENLPDIIKKQRMGWIKNLSLNLKDIEKLTETILYNENESFVEESWNQLKPLINWCKNIHTWFKKLIQEEYKTSDIQTLLNSLPNLLTTNITHLKDISKSYHSEIIPPVKNIITKIKETINWTATEPWTRPIKITGCIKGTKHNETINITCRNITKTYKDEDDGEKDGRINYHFKVPSNFSEENYFEPHNCSITIENAESEEKKQIGKTRLLLSYCFSDGVLQKNFTINFNAQITKPEEKTLYILDKKITSWFSTRIIGPITIKVNSTTKENNAISKVEFYINNDLKHTDNTAPWKWKWYLKLSDRIKQPLKNEYEIKVIAYDKLGILHTGKIKVRKL